MHRVGLPLFRHRTEKEINSALAPTAIIEHPDDLVPSAHIEDPQDNMNQIRFAVSPTIVAQTVPIGSPDHQEARHLQAQRFARVSSRDLRTGPTDTDYVAVTEDPSGAFIPIVVKQLCTYLSADATTGPKSRIVGTVRLDLSGAMLIESLIRLSPGSTSDTALKNGRVAEISTFATSLDLDKATVLDIIDGMVGVLVKLAQELRLDWLWIFPRNGFMSILTASIPDILPGYQFRLDRDVTGWNEESERLQQFRGLQLRGVSEYPEIYQISTKQFADDLAHRLALRPAREAHSAQMDRMLLQAMWHARRYLATDQRELYGSANLSSYRAARKRADEAQDAPKASGGDTFLPFEPATQTAAQYLHDVIEQGGRNAEDYKLRSYQLLDIQPGMRILDVGCGVGLDLPGLQERVGESGIVIGLDHNGDLVHEARQQPAVANHSNTLVFQGDAHQMSFPNATFDRVRADRTLQHCYQPSKVIGEMWRVLRPGGVLTVVEPDWKGMVLYPAGTGAQDDDTALSKLLAWYTQHIPHALIGRQLRALLAEQHDQRWLESHVQATSYSFYTWESVDVVLQASNAVQSLIGDNQAYGLEMEGWLAALQLASQERSFFAAVPLFFAYASKITTIA